MRKLLKFGCTQLLALSVTVGAVMAADLEVEVIHRWTSGGESKALNVFATALENAGGTWVDTPIADNQEAAATTRTIGGNPPGAFQFNTGTDLDELAAAGLLADLSSVANSQGWKDKIPPFVWDAIRRDDKVLAVPVNLQSEVWIWYSTEVFEKSGASIPTTWDELFESLDKIQEAGYIGLALGGQSWQERILFDKVLVGVAGPEFYYKLYSEDYAEALDSEQFDEVAEVYGRLRNYVDEGSPGRDWNVATNLVITNQAGLQVMGDWAKGEFTAAGYTPGNEYGCLEGPGSKAIVLSGDVFVMPRLSDSEGPDAGQAKLAELMFSEEVQVDFNLNKGSVPVRLDVDTSGLDACAQAAMETLQDPANALPSIGFFLSSDLRGQLTDSVTSFWNDKNLGNDDLREAMREAFETAM